LKGEIPEKAYQYALLCAGKMQQRFANDEAFKYFKDAIEVCQRMGGGENGWKKEAQARM
jgi:hypothetical protein